MKHAEGPSWTLSPRMRAFDLFVGSLLMPLVPASAVIIAPAIRLIDDVNPFFEQTRYGGLGHNTPFTAYKWRTMYEGTPEFDCLDGGVDNDQTTRTGKVLRPTHLDELPQVFNVLDGYMSINGGFRPRIKVNITNTMDCLSPREQMEWRQSLITTKPGLTSSHTIERYKQDSAESLHAAAMSDIEFAASDTLQKDIKAVRDTYGLAMVKMREQAHYLRERRRPSPSLEAAAHIIDVVFDPERSLVDELGVDPSAIKPVEP